MIRLSIRISAPRLSETARPHVNVMARRGSALLAVLALAACGAAEKSSVDVKPAPLADTAAVEPKPEVQVASLDAAALLKRGKIMFLRCSACHALDAAEGHKVGPNLNSVLGAVVGSQEGFTYSEVLASADGVWDEEALDAFLTKPSEYFPGTIMAFAGLEKAQDRAAVIEYLKVSTK